MASLYLTIKLQSGGSREPNLKDNVDFANRLIELIGSDPLLIARMEDGWNVSVQIRGFDPVVLEGGTFPGARSIPIEGQTEINLLARELLAPFLAK